MYCWDNQLFVDSDVILIYIIKLLLFSSSKITLNQIEQSMILLNNFLGLYVLEFQRTGKAKG